MPRDETTLMVGSVVLAVGLVGLVLAWRRGGQPIVLTMAFWVATLTLLTDKFDPTLLNGRYLAPTLPLMCVALGLVVASVAGRIRTPAFAAPAFVAALATVGLLMAQWLWTLTAYYDFVHAKGRSNEPILQAVAIARQQPRSEGGVVGIDERLASSYTIGGGRLGDTFAFLPMYDGIPTRIVAGDVAPDVELLLTVKDADRRLTTLGSGRAATRLSAWDDGAKDGLSFALLRLEP